MRKNCFKGFFAICVVLGLTSFSNLNSFPLDGVFVTKKSFQTTTGKGLLKRSQRVRTKKQHASDSRRTKKVKVPTALLRQLAADDSEVANFVNQGLTDKPSQNFTTELVDLNRDGKKEFIVLPPDGMMGNNNGPIWVYRQEPDGFKQLLRTAFMSYRVLATLHNGFRDLEMIYGGTGSGRVVDVFEFDGAEYVLRVGSGRGTE